MFFTFAGAELLAVEQRRQRALRLGLALRKGRLRVTGWPLDVLGAIRRALWIHLGAQVKARPFIGELRDELE